MNATSRIDTCLINSARIFLAQVSCPSLSSLDGIGVHSFLIRHTTAEVGRCKGLVVHRLDELLSPFVIHLVRRSKLLVDLYEDDHATRGYYRITDSCWR